MAPHLLPVPTVPRYCNRQVTLIACYGYQIMQYHVARAVTQSFGLDAENTIAGNILLCSSKKRLIQYIIFDFCILFCFAHSSCGQIFCADCSEFWAPLPDERLFNPVRLCGPCYHVVTTRIHQVIFRIA